MKVNVSKSLFAAVFCTLGLASTGCQTYEVGQSLPSAHHMTDDVHYFAKGPQFPLAQELNAMSAAEADRTATNK